MPKQHRAKIHSTNPLERLNGEIKRRTDIVGTLPSEAAIIRLVGAGLPMDAVAMFGSLVLQALYGLSDEPPESHVRDRLPFICFLGLTLADRVPDRPAWLTHQTLARVGAMDALSAWFIQCGTERAGLRPAGRR